MIDAESVPPVDDDELLARYVVNSNEFRKSDNTVRPKLFMPYKRVTLSVTRHRDCTEKDIWRLGFDIAKERGCQLYGRADIIASACRFDPLNVISSPIESNPNHAEINGFPSKKEDQQSVALKLAAAAGRRIPSPNL